MRLNDSTVPICQLASQLEDDLRQRADTGLQKPHIPAIADIVAAAISTRSVNTCVWKQVLPRKNCNDHAREKFIHRTLSNPLIHPEQVMASYGGELLLKLSTHGETVILMLDQSKLVDGIECLMLSIRVGERALPWLWKIVETSGGIGFDVQESLLDVANVHLPDGVAVMLMGDRFYGTSALVQWCHNAGWAYRLRLRKNLNLSHDGGLLVTGELLAQGVPFVEKVEMGGVVTNVGVIHDKGHPEPWIIAMECKPTRERVLDYGLRWGIESLFSDLKSRGFEIDASHLRHPDRLSRLLMVVTIALYWCVSIGEAEERVDPVLKKEVCVLGLHEGCAG
jgi:hypothetical protein